MKSVRAALLLFALAVIFAAQASMSGAAGPGPDDECAQVVQAIMAKLNQLQFCDSTPIPPGYWSECDLIEIDLEVLRNEARIFCNFEWVP